MSARSIQILLVQGDSRGEDAFLATLKAGRLANPVVRAEDAHQALNLLQTAPELPDVVLLDLNWPKMDGYELMSEMRHDARLAHIPLIVMTDSHADERLVNELDMAATCCVGKPLTVERLLQAILRFGGFGLAIVPGDTR